MEHYKFTISGTIRIDKEMLEDFRKEILLGFPMEYLVETEGLEISVVECED